MVEPSVPQGGFEHEPQRHDLVVECAARRRLERRRLLALRELALRLLAADRRLGRAMDPVLLHLSGGHFGEPELSEIGEEVQAEADLVSFRPFRTALAFGDRLILGRELLGCVGEGLLLLEDARAKLAAELDIPVLSDVLRVLKQRKRGQTIV